MTKSNDTIRILTSGTCQTLTGSSPLTYTISKEPEGGIHLRISNNSGGSFVSDEWVALRASCRPSRSAMRARPSPR